MNTNRLRVAVIFHRFGPYHVARLQAASRHSDITGIELGSETSEYAWSRVSSSDSDNHITLFPDRDSRTAPIHELVTRVEAALRDCQPGVVAMPGWSDKGALAALRWCLNNNVPAILMSESTVHDERRHWWKEWIKRHIVKLFSSALVGGRRHVDYLVKLGMRRERIFIGYDVVDNDYFRQRGEEVKSQLSEIRGNYRLPKNYFLASARFIEKKNLPTLIHAYSDYRKRAANSGQKSDVWHLVLLGDGPQKPDLYRMIGVLNLRDSVILPGFKQYDELPTYYALANAFVHASTSEPWGLVVNEATASGLPVIVSDKCGCVPELVQENENGFTFDPSDRDQLTSHLLTMASMSEHDRAKFSQSSYDVAARFEVDEFGRGLESATGAALSLVSKKPDRIARFLLERLLFQ